MKKFIKKCPLTFSIIIAFIAVNVCGGIAIYKNVIPFDISMTHPVVASVFEYVSDKNNNTEYIYDETPIEPIGSLHKPDEDSSMQNTTISDEENIFLFIIPYFLFAFSTSEICSFFIGIRQFLLLPNSTITISSVTSCTTP